MLPVSSTTTHAQPDPKRVVAAVANSSLAASSDPQADSIAAATSGVGVPPPLGPHYRPEE